jgi:hypothetical protein
MTLTEQYQAAILIYAPQDRQLNSIIKGEFTDYINIVMILISDHYNNLVDRGDTEWYLPTQIIDTLTSMKPY